MQGGLGNIALQVCVPSQRSMVQRSLRQLEFWRFAILACQDQEKSKIRDSQSRLELSAVVDLIARTMFIDHRWQISHTRSPTVWLLSDALNQRKGSPLLTLMVLQYLAKPLGLRVGPITPQRPTVARFTRADEYYYLNLQNPSTPVDDNQILAAVSEEYHIEKYSLELHYVEECLGILVEYGNDELAMQAVNYLCDSYPRRMDFVARRALLQHRQGAMPSALKDLKKFFSFYSENKAPRDLVKIYRRLSTHWLRSQK